MLSYYLLYFQNLTIMLSRRNFIKISAIATLASCQRPATSKIILRFAVASDGHFGQPNTNFQLYHDNVIKNLQKEKAERGLEFVVFNGDLFHDDIKFLPEVKQNFDKLGFSYYVTRGNHDHATPAQWQQTWGYALNHVVRINKKNAIILADTSNEKGEYLCPNLEWLDKELSKLKATKNVFLFAHIPSKFWSEHGTTCPQREEIFKRYPNLKATFHGHDHAIDSLKVDVKPALFDGHFGGSWGVNYKGYRIVEVYSDGKIHTYQYNYETQTKVNDEVF